MVAASDLPLRTTEILFCCVQRNAETSCHKHFVVCLLRTTNDAAYCYTNLPLSGAAVYITHWRLHR